MDAVSRAQNAENSGITAAKQRIIGRPFAKGQSGNPGGRPKKLHITKMFEHVLGKPNNRKEIEESILEELKRRGMAKVLLLREMAERTEGKIAQELNIEGTVTLALAETVSERRKRLGNSDTES